jgi:hypothetical protein
MIRLVQIADQSTRRVALVDEPYLRCLSGASSIYELTQFCLGTHNSIAEYVDSHQAGESLLFDEIYDRRSRWRLLPPIDVPDRPSRLLVSGTGLTHLGSARERQAMHVAERSDPDEAITDSMRMFRWGVEGGCPPEGRIGVAPEWFYKGDGSILRAPFDPLEIPAFAEDGGEEAEIAGIYIIDDEGTPCRIGMAQGNEFSDHKFEKRNYLNLAGSKLRSCSLGPELVVSAEFGDLRGEVRIEREGACLWRQEVRSGEANMCHSLANLEHHHFKFAGHRQPGSIHVHFFGADALSFGKGIVLREGDIAEVRFDGFGRALRNPILEADKSVEPIRVNVLA